MRGTVMGHEWSKKIGMETAKALGYSIILAASIFAVNVMFKVISSLKRFSSYTPYIYTVLLFLIGYKIVMRLSQATYYAMRKFTDHSTAAAVRTITKIAGIAGLLSITTSIFGVSASSALTVGSFSGLIVGFATQTVLTHAVAGIFIAVSRPFKIGDLVTIAGKTGVVKEIKLMHTILFSQKENCEILIPSGKIIGEIIVKSQVNGSA